MFWPRKIIPRCCNELDMQNLNKPITSLFQIFLFSFSKIWTHMWFTQARDVHRKSLTFCAISDNIPATHGCAEMIISIVPLIPTGNSQEISSETNYKHRLRSSQIVIHFTISPTSRLQMLPIYVWESSCNILSNTVTLDILKHSWNTDTVIMFNI